MFGFVCAAAGVLAIVGSVATLIIQKKRQSAEIDKLPDNDYCPACAVFNALVCPYMYSERDCENCEYGNGGYFLDAEEAAKIFEELASKAGGTATEIAQNIVSMINEEREGQK